MIIYFGPKQSTGHREAVPKAWLQLVGGWYLRLHHHKHWSYPALSISYSVSQFLLTTAKPFQSSVPGQYRCSVSWGALFDPLGSHQQSSPRLPAPAEWNNLTSVPTSSFLLAHPAAAKLISLLHCAAVESQVGQIRAHSETNCEVLLCHRLPASPHRSDSEDGVMCWGYFTYRDSTVE